MASSKHTLEFTDGDFDREVVQSDQPVLVDFWASWCQPCLIVGPTIDALADEYAGRIKVGKVDVDANQVVASKLGISSIPTILVFRDGEIIHRFVGVTGKDEISATLDRLAA